MYITGKGRYDQYTSRYDVYLFTLRDYTEVILDRFTGRYLERSDMPIHTGYLLESVKVADIKAFIAANATSSTTVKDGITTYVLPHLEGNTLPVYATVADALNIVYIGLSNYPEALDRYLEDPDPQVVNFTISFNANEGTGTMNDITVPSGTTYTIPASTFTAPEDKVFDKWNTKANGSGTNYAPNDELEVTENTTLFAQWIDNI